MGAEIRVMHPQNKEMKNCQEPPEFGRGKEGSVARDFKGSTTLPTPGFQPSDLQTVIERISVALHNSICNHLL